MRKSKCIFTSLFEKDKPIAVVLGGVLSALAFSLIPNSANALQVAKFPDADYHFNSSSIIAGGCITTNANLGNGIEWLVGSSLDATNITDPCHNATVDNPSPTHLSYDSTFSNGRSYIEYTGNSKTTDTYTSGDITNKTRYWGQIPRNLYNATVGFNFAFGTLGDSNDFRTPVMDAGASDSYTLFLYTFSSPSGTTGFIPTLVSNVGVLDINGNDISNTPYLDSTYSQEITNKIKKSINYSCGDVASQTPIPEEFDTSTFTNDTCFITFVVPTSANYQVQMSQFSFIGASEDYDIKLEDGNNIDRWRMSIFQITDSYKSMETNWNGDLEHSLPVLQYLAPNTQLDGDYLMNFAETLFANHEYNMTHKGTPPNNSIYQNWWDVFTISFTFPFQNLFTAFTDNQCVDIPIIAGMLHSSTTRYCTWWSASVRNILTPVITMASLMLATGFAMRWLSEKTSVITIGGK